MEPLHIKRQFPCLAHSGFRWVALPLAILIFPILFVQFNVYNWGLRTPLSVFLPFPFFLIGYMELNMVIIYGLFFSAG